MQHISFIAGPVGARRGMTSSRCLPIVPTKGQWTRRGGFPIAGSHTTKVKETLKMKKPIGLRTLPWLLFASLTATAAHAAGNKVVIGDIDDMSGLYADVIGPGGIEAAKMAIADFGGSVLGNKIELLTKIGRAHV